MGSWEEWCTYCKELAEYYVCKYKTTKLELLELVSKKRRHDTICGGADVACGFWNSILPHEFRDKQIEKLFSFRISMQSAMDEILEWVMCFSFPEFGGAKSFFKYFTWDSLFWLLNLALEFRILQTETKDYFPRLSIALFRLGCVGFLV